MSTEDMRSLMARSIRNRPRRILILHQFANRTYATIAEVVDVVDFAATVAQVDERAHHRDDVLAAQYAHGVWRVEIEAHIHLDPTNRGKIITLGIKKQRVEHRLGRLDRRRLAWTHHAIDVEQGFLALALSTASVLRM